MIYLEYHPARYVSIEKRDTRKNNVGTYHIRPFVLINIYPNEDTKYCVLTPILQKEKINQ